MDRFPFGRSEPEEPDADEIIDRIENTLQNALERRQEIRRELRQELRRYRIARKEAESQMGRGGVDEDIELTGHRVDGYEEVIDELRQRIKALNEQIVGIEKRMPTLQVLRTDAELMRRLANEESVEEDVLALEEALSDDSPREASANTKLQSLLQSIDSMASQGGSAVPATPNFPVDLDADADDVTDEAETADVMGQDDLP